ncbi:hypothetical protein O5585_28530, partial [Escherichia coli]|nr:hypothetical protein [Escherichia coli]
PKSVRVSNNYVEYSLPGTLSAKNILAHSNESEWVTFRNNKNNDDVDQHQRQMAVNQAKQSRYPAAGRRFPDLQWLTSP